MLRSFTKSGSADLSTAMHPNIEELMIMVHKEFNLFIDSCFSTDNDARSISQEQLDQVVLFINREVRFAQVSMSEINLAITRLCHLHGITVSNSPDLTPLE